MSISPGPGAAEGHRDPALMEHSEYTDLETNTKATNGGCLFGARCSREPATSLVWQRLEDRQSATALRWMRRKASVGPAWSLLAGRSWRRHPV